jgi:hypothetical protein
MVNYRRKKRLSWFAVVFIFYEVSVALAAVPTTLNYQGQLTDYSGTPLNGFYLINFYLYSSETEGSNLWTEQQLVEVANGVFNVSLGTVEPFTENLFDNSTLYLELQIFNSSTGWEILTPRQQFASAAFAMKAAMAEGVANGGVINVMIADGAINTAKIAAGAVSLDKIADGAIVTEILTHDGSGSDLDADLLDGLDSSAFAASNHTHEYLGVWKHNGTGNYVYPSGEESTFDPDVWVCIGNQTPETLLHIYDFSYDSSGGEDHRPQINIYQDGAGDAAQTFRLQFDGGNKHHFTLGIDKHFTTTTFPPSPDSFDFKICHETYEEVGGAVPATLGYLKGEAYDAAEMMVRIHGTDWPESGPDKKASGIIDFNHQSRARVYLSSPQIIVPGVWIGVEFDTTMYDEHDEVALGSSNTPAVFTATETGYYQVNARVEFEIDAGSLDCGSGWDIDSYVSIAIYHNQTSHYAFGNNLQIYNHSLADIVGSEGGWFAKNSGPNISDVIFLQAGDTIEIQVFQNACEPLPLTGGAKNLSYFSIHKVS